MVAPLVTITGAVVARGDAQMLGPVDLEAGAEGVTVLMGPNGAGKTTLLKLMHGLERPRAGRVTWNGVARSEQAFVFQRPILLRRSVQANLELPLRLRSDPSPVDDLAGELGLTPLLGTHAPRLSGGEAQKLALARALVTRPRVLFLDEPTANLDAPTVTAMEEVFRRKAAGGVRLFLATHSAGQARRLADNIVWVDHGSVTGPISAPEFFAHPPPAAAGFLEMLA
ncbi:MAG: ATP-binding cassette domain-containing protein [Pseudomonadota bacterium]